MISIHALLAESDVMISAQTTPQTTFQSTLSSRRATLDRFFLGEKFLISIHALLAESDGKVVPKLFISLLISIHALLAESDVLPPPYLT